MKDIGKFLMIISATPIVVLGYFFLCFFICEKLGFDAGKKDDQFSINFVLWTTWIPFAFITGAVLYFV